MTECSVCGLDVVVSNADLPNLVCGSCVSNAITEDGQPLLTLASIADELPKPVILSGIHCWAVALNENVHVIRDDFDCETYMEFYRRHVLLNPGCGALVGLAVGDALGATLEFTKAGAFEPITDMVGGGPHNVKPGQWTDDTSMALCLAESLIECAKFDPADQMERYVRWWRDGHLSSKGECFDIGGSTEQALMRFQTTHEPYSGSTDPASSGNGSLMRLAPVVIRYAKDPERAIELAAESSRTTHGSDMAVDSCRYFAGLLIGAIQGRDKSELLSQAFSPLGMNYWDRHPLDPMVSEVATGSFRHREPPKIHGGGRGFVVTTLEAALWAFNKTDNFRDGALMAVNLGEDADTVGAVYGQIAGAYYGEFGIPRRWRMRLHQYSLIREYAEKLCLLAGF